MSLDLLGEVTLCGAMTDAQYQAMSAASLKDYARKGNASAKANADATGSSLWRQAVALYTSAYIAQPTTWNDVKMADLAADNAAKGAPLTPPAPPAYASDPATTDAAAAGLDAPPAVYGWDSWSDGGKAAFVVVMTGLLGAAAWGVKKLLVH